MRAHPVGTGEAALRLLPVLETALASGSEAILPVPADDEREAASLVASLRAGASIRDDVAAVVPTSGTTGAPKGSMLTATALTASATATAERLGGAARWLMALPAHHVAGLQVLVRSVLAGTTPVALAPSFDVSELPSAVARLGSGRRHASLVAVQVAKALCDPAATAALAELDAVLVGGGPMPPAVAEKAHAAGVSLVRTYGMSETAGGCVYDGRPLDGVDVRIDGGRVVLGGPTLALGYRNPTLPDPFGETGWFRTEDVGSIDDSGTLHVIGRIDDAIVTGGLKVFPQLVEAALATHPAVDDCAIFGVPDERLGQRVVAAIVVTAGHEPPTVAQLRSHAARTLDQTAAPREVHVVGVLPRRGIGKLDRRKLTTQFSSGG